MIQMLKQLFSMFTVLFSAGEKIAKTADNFATWAEEGSGSFADQARIERKQKLALLNNQTDTQARQLENDSKVATRAANKAIPA